MLLTLLPFTAWADDKTDLSTVAVSIELSNPIEDETYQLTYVGQATEPGMHALTVNGQAVELASWYNNYKFEFFDSQNAATPLDEMRNTGTYWVGVAAKDYNQTYTGRSAAASRVKVVMNKRALHITLQNATKVYGDDDLTSLQVYPQSGLVGQDNVNNIGLQFSTRPRVVEENPENVGDHNYAFTTNEDGSCVQITSTNYVIFLDEQPTLTITRAPLTAWYAPEFNELEPDDDDVPTGSADIFTKYYGEGLTLTATADNLRVMGWKAEETPDAKATLLGAPSLTPTNVNANVFFGTTADNFGNVGYGLYPQAQAHTATLSVTNATATEEEGVFNLGDNYTIEFVSPKLYITPAEIKAVPGLADTEEFSFSQDETNYTYNGTEQIPTNIAVVYRTVVEEPTPVTNLATLTQKIGESDGDFVITYERKNIDAGVETYAADANGNIFAGNYRATLSAVPNGNYYTAEGGVVIAEFAYSIAKKSISVYVADGNKTYNAQPANAAPLTIGWSNLVLADAEANVADNYFDAQFVDNAGHDIEAPVNASAVAYKVMAKPNAAWTDVDVDAVNYTQEEADAYNMENELTELDEDYKTTESIKTPAIPASPLAINYTPSYSKANFFINKKVATFTADPQSVKFGAAKDIETTPYNTAVAEDHIKTVSIDGFEETDIPNILAAYVLSLDLTMVEDHVGPYAGAIKVNQVELNPENEGDAAILTTIGNYNFTPAAGTFSITASEFTIFAKERSIVYGTTYTMADAAFDFGTVNFDGVWPEQATVSYQLKLTADGDPVPVEALPKNVGTYYILPVVNNWPENHDYAEPAVALGLFKITKKPVYIKPDALYLNNGATDDVLETLGSVTYYNDLACTEKTDLAYTTDEIKSTLSFNVYDAEDNNDEEALLLNEDEELNCTVGETYERAIKVTAEADEEGYANKNYDIRPVFGAVTVLEVKTLVIRKDDANMYNKIKIAAEECNPDNDATWYNVTFDVPGRTLTGQTWESFVLPFDISAAQLSQSLKANPDDYGYAIFNVYNEGASDASHVRFSLTMDMIPANTPFLVKTEKNVNVLDNILIKKVCIVDPKSANPKKVVEGKVTMVGCYENTPITKNDHFFFQGTWMNGADSETAPTILPATMAYWTPADPKARIFVEDLDENGATAIKEINAQTMREIAAEGWYTIDGIKLQSMPTEKGVYINNGKKVVIK